jgi:hypothetical protein
VPTTKDKKRDELEKFFAIGDAYVDYAQSFPRLFEIAFIHPAEHKVGEYDELAWKILNESVENFVMLGLTPRGKRETAPPRGMERRAWTCYPCCKSKYRAIRFTIFSKSCNGRHPGFIGKEELTNMSEKKLEPKESDNQIDQEESQKGSSRDEEILREKPPHH